MIPFRAIALTLLLGAAPALKVSSYLQLPGIPGESTDEKHKNWITIESVSFGATQSGASGTSGSSAGKMASHDVQLTKETDKSSARIEQAAANGKHFASAELDVGTLRYIFTEVIISAVQHTGQTGSGNGANEHLTLNYASMKIIYPSNPGTTASAAAAMAPRATMTPVPAGGAHPPAAPATTMRGAAAPATMAAPAVSPAASLASELTPSLSAAAKQWVGTEGRALSQSTGTADQLAANAHRAALSRFGGIQPNVAGALSFLALMDAAKANHSAQIESAIGLAMGTTSAAAAGGLANLK